MTGAPRHSPIRNASRVRPEATIQAHPEANWCSQYGVVGSTQKLLSQNLPKSVNISYSRQIFECEKLGLSFMPVASRVVQKVMGYQTLEECAARTVSIARPEVMPLAEAIYLQDELDRVTGTHDMAVSLEDELGQTVASHLENIETHAYLIRDAMVGNNRVSTWAGFKDLSMRHARCRPLRVTEELDAAALCSTWQGNDFFAHFLIDDAATYSLAEDFAEPFYSGADMPRSPHCLDYLSRFGSKYVERQHVRVRDLWLFRDYSLGPDKRRRLQSMAARAKAATPASEPSPGAFIRRGVTGQVRALENAAEIEAWCVAQGFVIVDPEHQSVDEICAALKGVPLVVGVEGSHLVHALFTMAEGGAIVCIQPADRFNVIFRHLSAALNLHWGFVVAEGTSEGFHLELDKLKATLQLVQERIANGGCM
ncbi:glycosyltransferase family 61 protein [Sedimentitalea todarodis]|uniref:Glycosyltransferase family 61 protein n=1 Tax=Sedimentitalea todarodis TaxID=1631240 RepID=A0ABU3VHA6_9RHOB|nr:glycosyltransferase family 61 protein [Sedimentitalea todarodis]MDU9005546.1 glycosyltransferase family 61 protein [Sedimentitalea todarodis]